MENRFLVVPITHDLFMEAMKGVEPLSTGLQDRRSVIQLSYIAKVAQTLLCDCSDEPRD